MKAAWTSEMLVPPEHYVTSQPRTWLKTLLLWKPQLSHQLICVCNKSGTNMEVEWTVGCFHILLLFSKVLIWFGHMVCHISWKCFIIWLPQKLI